LQGERGGCGAATWRACLLHFPTSWMVIVEYWVGHRTCETINSHSECSCAG